MAGFNNGVVDLAAASEGTFTPTIVGSVSAGSTTYTNQLGVYYLIGDLVFIYARVEWSSTSGGSGNLHVEGLPFTAKNTSGLRPMGAFIVDNLDLNTASNTGAAEVFENTTYFKIVMSRHNTNLWVVPMVTSGSGLLTGSFVYLRN